MFERFQKKSEVAPIIQGPQILARILYPADFDVADIVHVLTEGGVKGVQINLVDHEIICPQKYRELIEQLFSEKDTHH